MATTKIARRLRLYANGSGLVVGHLVGAGVAYADEVQTVTVTATAQNERQTVTVTADGGTFTLTYAGQTTAPIAFDAAAATVATALKALSNIADTDVAVTGSAGGPFTVEFQGALAKLNVAQMTADATSLTGVAHAVVVATSQAGLAGGTFTLTFDGQTTAPIAYDATAAAVKAALVALSNIGANDVNVSGSAGGPYTVTFVGALAKTNVAALTADGALLTGNTPGVLIETGTAGATGIVAVSGLKLGAQLVAVGEWEDETRTDRLADASIAAAGELRIANATVTNKFDVVYVQRA